MKQQPLANDYGKHTNWHDPQPTGETELARSELEYDEARMEYLKARSRTKSAKEYEAQCLARKNDAHARLRLALIDASNPKRVISEYRNHLSKI